LQRFATSGRLPEQQTWAYCLPSRPAQFRARQQRDRAALNAEYDARRGSARVRGYGAAWDDVSAGFRRQHPLCPGCEAVGLITPTEVTDHVEPHKGDPVKFWNADMWHRRRGPLVDGRAARDRVLVVCDLHREMRRLGQGPGSMVIGKFPLWEKKGRPEATSFWSSLLLIF